jgi:beta-galactosidase
VNGQHVGQHRGGYTAFAFEITDHVKTGDNQVEVIVSNEERADVIPLSGDFPLFGGIHRSVRLITTESVCITPLDYASPGVYIRQRDLTPASGTVDVTAKVSNGTTAASDVAVQVTVRDAGGAIVAESGATTTVAASQTAPAKVTLKVDTPALWHGLESPYLYSVSTVLSVGGRVVDEVVQPLGFRSFRFDKDEGFFLNGQYQKIHGVSRHQDVKGRGAALTEADHRRDLELILDMGTNSVRLSHYPHSEFFYDLCDSTGLTTWSEIAWVGSNASGYNDTEELKANIRESLIEMIRQNYNHPSVLVWGIYNELHDPEELSPVPFIRELHELAKEEDPDRPTTAANHMMGEMQGNTDLTAWNHYFGWYRGHSPQIGDWFDEAHRKYPDVPIGIAEYGAGGSINHHEEDLTRPFPFAHPWHPEEWQAEVHEENWKEISSRKFVWGSYIWNMFDFASFFRREGDALGMNDKGMVTYDRSVRKDVFYFYRANWSERPTVHIANRRHRLRQSDHISVKAYSNAEEVSLNVNGETVGTATGDQGVFRWDDVALSKGNNVVIASASIGGVTHEDRVVWLYDQSGTLDLVIAFFQYGIKPILVLSLLMVFVAFGQGWKAKLSGWKKWTWRGVFALSATVFLVITGGWIYAGTYRIDIFAYSLI